MSTPHIRGIPQLMMRLDKLDRAYGDKGEALQNVIIRGAKITQTNIRTEAPYKTGALRRAIIAKELSRLKNLPAAIVKANYSPSEGPTARHAHLVEHGHVASGWPNVVQKGEHIPGNPFFYRGVERSKGVVRQMIQRELSKLVNKAAGR